MVDLNILKDIFVSDPNDICMKLAAVLALKLTYDTKVKYSSYFSDEAYDFVKGDTMNDVLKCLSSQGVALEKCYSPDSIDDINYWGCFRYECTDFFFSYQIALDVIKNSAIQSYLEIMESSKKEDFGYDDAVDWIMCHFDGSDSAFEYFLNCVCEDDMDGLVRWLVNDILMGAGVIVEYLTGEKLDIDFPVSVLQYSLEFLGFNERREEGLVFAELVFRDYCDAEVFERASYRICFDTELAQEEIEDLREFYSWLVAHYDVRLVDDLTEVYHSMENHYMHVIDDKEILIMADRDFFEVAAIYLWLAILILKVNQKEGGKQNDTQALCQKTEAVA